MQDHKYKISVIVPVYNVEKYLDECIQSVTKQTIGFKKNIQLILINDGSADDSEKICLKYKKKYPDNVIYVKQENSGVSVARNNGLNYVQGKYVNFLDSDDKWDRDAFAKAYKMLEKNNNIDLVGFRLKYFELSKKYHWLDYKFTGDRIIDIFDEPSGIVIHGPTVIIRYSAIANIRFDENLKISEDTKFIYQIILQKKHYGIISSSLYNYRKRDTHSSAMQTAKQKKYWYIDTLKNCQKFLVDYSLEKYGKVIPFVQYFIMYDLLWRLKANVGFMLNQKEKNEYENQICSLLQYIDDDVIMNQALITHNFKLFCLKIKYGDNFYNDIEIKNNTICYKDLVCTEFSDFSNTIEIFKIEKDSLIIEGRMDYIENAEFYYKLNGKLHKLDTYEREDKSFELNKNYKLKILGYTLHLSISGIKDINFLVKADDTFYNIKNNLIHYCLLNKFNFGYYYQDKYLITAKNVMSISIKHNPCKLRLFAREICYLTYITLAKKRLAVTCMRLLYWLSKPFMPKNIWLFCDREFMAGDSGELLFKYVNSHNNNNTSSINTYFVIDKNYKDFERMKQYGNVVSYHTLKYKLLFLNAKYLISSHADGYVNNEFGNSKEYYIDLYKFKYIYLTHGILLHDSSSWLNRINKNIYLNVVTSPIESDALLSDKYYFEKENLMISGLPRYDDLFSDVEEKNQILFMPSWRSTLAPNIILGTQRREYNKDFKKSEYYLFYQKLLNDERLLKILKEKDLRIKFCVHPSFRAQFNDFVGNDFVEFAIDVNAPYETKCSKFLVTDYSSAACDFAYLKKPVIYANFDYDKVFNVHYYSKGEFDYEKDGFGPNCTSYDDTLKAIINTINNNCKMEDKYLERCNKFFYFNDNRNCERVFKYILDSEKQK